MAARARMARGVEGGGVSLEFTPFVVVYLIACMVLIDLAVLFDVRRRRLPLWLVLLPVVFGPPGGMAYFIWRPPYAGE